MNQIEIICRVDNEGKIVSGRKRLTDAIHQHLGKQIRVTVERLYSKRSSPQNRFFHGVVIPLIQERLLELGWKEAKSAQWVKDVIKMQCLLSETASAHGEVILAIRPTSGLSRTEFMELIEDVQQWAAEKLDLQIPNPNEQNEMEL